MHLFPVNVQDISEPLRSQMALFLACAPKKQITDTEFYFLFSSELQFYFLIQVLKLINVASLRT